ncbi:MAG: carboxypeptidase M32 [Candidatus Sumerlaeaceae bacterium]
MTENTDPYLALIRELKEIAVLASTVSLLHWDEQTQLPLKGGANRAEQISLLVRLCHERFTSARVGGLLGEAETAMGDLDEDTERAANLRETRRAYERQTKLPGSLVEELSRTTVLGQQAWVQARKNSNYAEFEPWLSKIIGLKREEARCISVHGPLYDALLDEFEPGETSENLRRVFEELRSPLIDLVANIRDSGRKAPAEILTRHYPADAQEAFARKAATAIGFDFEAGRLDRSVHPFCSIIAPGDTRMTTRYDENYFGDAFFGVLHETGHGLYDQGLPTENFGTPLGEAVSLGIHESQSRMWENLVGRARPFWHFMMPAVRAAFPAALASVSDEEWMFAINDIRPSLIRTESDETTYNLHIMIRFELEQALLHGDLSTADLPGAWNDKVESFLGLVPPTDAMGCLQDIHWSSGAIGYFPTYTLGNLIAAQLFETAKRNVADLEEGFGRGDFVPLLKWLRENVHQHGKRYSAGQLVQQATGASLSAAPLLRHLRTKAHEYYGVSA